MKGWRDVLISFLVALLLGVTVGGKVFGVSEARVRELAKDENTPLREAVTDLKSSVSELTKSVNALTVQISVLQSRT